MRRFLPLVILVLVLVVAGLGAANTVRPVPALAPRNLQAATLTVGRAPSFTWPPGTEDAIGAQGLGVLAQTPHAAPEPTGSVAKVMTALVALQKLPLKVGQQGPSITITAADQALQQQDAAEGQSTVPVEAGETLTEYQVLQGMLLPSGNNLAMLLAAWAFGSSGAAASAMNAEAKTLGLQGSLFTDPSGFDPSTVSTPADLVKLGMAAMQNAVIAQIVGQAHATLPVAGLVSNVNTVLGADGIVGIKTGNTTGQDGAFLYAAREPAAGPMIVGAVMGSASVEGALDDALGMVGQAQHALTTQTILGADTEAALVQAPWGGPVPIVTRKSLTALTWGGQRARIRVRLRPLTAPVPRRARVGTLTATLGTARLTTPLETSAPIGSPPWTWRLLRRPPHVPAGDWPL